MPQSPLYGAIDLGSNSFHMLVVRQVHGAIRIVSKVKRKVRLASGLDENNLLSREAMERGWDCLRLFSEQLQDVPSENIRIVGTATLRIAKNADVFVRVAEEILGHKVEVISGLEEARTIYQGVSCTTSGSGSRLVIDIGGASTEIILGHGNNAELLNSLQLGCVTWYNSFFSEGTVTADSFNEAVQSASDIFREVVDDYLAIGWDLCVGASGTVQALQEILISQGGSERVTLDKMYQLRDLVIKCCYIDDLDIVGLLPERKKVFPSGLAILIALFEVFGIKELLLAGGALREGLVYGMIVSTGHSDEQWFGDARVRTVESMIYRYQLDRSQGERVKDVCLHIFDAMKDEWKLDDLCRSILISASLLYELGLCIEYKKAPQHASYIVENIDMPGFTVPQKLLLSGLLFNQRDDFKLDALHRQHAVSYEAACFMARILRIAIILCIRRTEGTVPNFEFRLEKGVLKILLPKGWLASHYLRGSELLTEVRMQTQTGWPTVAEERQE